MDGKLQILQHSLGVDQYGNGRQYRNHFCTGPSSADYDYCLALTAEGLMTRRTGSEISGGDDIFHVTAKGVDFVALNSPIEPPAPKLTRSQKNYQEFLTAECNETFGEWMRFKRKTP